MNVIILSVATYFAGSVNFAIILFKLLGKQDPRTSFSGNAGTANVYRQAGPAWAALVLLLDAGRAVSIALLALHFLPLWQVPWPGLALVIGNRYPCFHRFRGGKGVASYLGFSAVIAPLGAAVSAFAWVLAYLLKRVTFIASFVMILVLAAFTIVEFKHEPVAIAGTVLTLLFIVYNHKKNMAELKHMKKTGTKGIDSDINGNDDG